MKNIFTILLAVLIFPVIGFSQKLPSKLVFRQGQVYRTIMEVKNIVSQEAMGNAIDFNVDGIATHDFKVTNTTDDNSTLHHSVKKLSFKFEGMGQNRSFDSENEKDLKGFFGPGAKDILSKSYDIIIDPSGKTLMVKPEKIELTKTDDRLSIIFNMLKDVTSIVYPPKKNEPSFFKVLPDNGAALNDSWTESGEDSIGKFSTTYTLTSITDSTLVVDLKGKSASVNKSEMMGVQATTTMNNSYTGKIILDKATGIIKEKIINTESNGNTEAMGGNMPVTSKTIITIRVVPVNDK
jgi:hypothetical protein